MDITSFANQHPIIFFFTLLLVVLPIVVVLIGVIGEAIIAITKIFKK